MLQFPKRKKGKQDLDEDNAPHCILALISRVIHHCERIFISCAIGGCIQYIYAGDDNYNVRPILAKSLRNVLLWMCPRVCVRFVIRFIWEEGKEVHSALFSQSQFVLFQSRMQWVAAKNHFRFFFRERRFLTWWLFICLLTCIQPKSPKGGYSKINTACNAAAAL